MKAEHDTETNKILEVRIWGDPILRVKAEPVDEIPDELRELVPSMVETMKIEDGVGLAANQIGLTKRLIAVTDGEETYVIFNPEIVSWSSRRITDVEGCLSLPSLQAEVERWAKVIVKGLTPDGKKTEIVARGLLARAAQHEIDHLNGVLFIDRMVPDTLKWSKRIPGTDEVEHISTDLDDVRRTYIKDYHGDREDLVFDKE